MHRFLLVIILLFIAAPPVFSQNIASPEETFGFQMGADRKLINWEQISGYFEMLDRNSDRLQLHELGRTTLDRPMLMAIISSEETMSRLDHYKRIQQQLAAPYGISDEQGAALVDSSKSVVIITMNIHSNEIASSQGSVELAYEFATSNSEEVRHILDNVIFLMVPSVNPDGQDMIAKWYLSTVGTPYEGSRMPHKYHHYADHDNNRDWFFFNLKESRHVAQILYHEWYPEIVMDQHQMGSSGARYFLPPYADPVNPNVPPSLTANTNLIGKYMISEMQEQGFKGLVTGTIFNAYFEGTMSKTPLWHNRIGILTEAASVRYASPLYFPRTSLRGMGIDLPEYKQQTNFVDPWPGGWWRLRDIVEYQKAAAYSVLEAAAFFKKKYKTHFFDLNKRAIEVSPADHAQAYVFPLDQHDPSNMVELLRRLRIANVQVFRAEHDFTTDAGDFTEGDFIVPLNQPARNYIKDLLEIQHYPDLREYPGGPPRRPYDVTAWTLPLQLGVEAIELAEAPVVAMERVETVSLPDAGDASSGQIVIERRHTRGYELVNRLLDKGLGVHELQKKHENTPAGSFIVEASGNAAQRLNELNDDLNVPIAALADNGSEPEMRSVENARIGIYQPWISWIYDEGWLRLILDEFGFEYTTLHNKDFHDRTQYSKDFDVLVFSSQGGKSITDGRADNTKNGLVGEPKIRKEYSGGIGAKNAAKLITFMEEGGTILFFGRACELAIDALKLPVRNPLKGLDRDEFFIPGSILEMNLDLGSPLTYGMKEKTPVYWNRPVALSLRAYPHEIGETGFFGEHNILMSGWAVGEKKLAGQAALAEIPVGKGRAILYAFRPQHRGQTWGTLKLIFNALYKYQ